MMLLRNCAILLAILTAACANAMPTGGFEGKVISTADGVQFRVETVATGLEVPWGFAWLPNKDLLVTEQIKLDDAAHGADDAAYAVAQSAAETQGEALFATMMQEHKNRLAQERERLKQAFEARSQAIGRRTLLPAPPISNRPASASLGGRELPAAAANRRPPSRSARHRESTPTGSS